MQRDSAGIGERGAANWVAGRLREAGAAEVGIEPFRYQGTFAHAHALHHAAGLAAAATGHPAGRALALAALASLELEGSGRAQWLRRLLPAGEGANVVARIPAAGAATETIVLVAHHDAARGGLFWHPRLAGLTAARNARRRAIDGYLQPAAAGYALAALPWRPARGVGAALLASALLAALDIARSPTVPGASDNATGVAAPAGARGRARRRPASRHRRGAAERGLRGVRHGRDGRVPARARARPGADVRPRARHARRRHADPAPCGGRDPRARLRGARPRPRRRRGGRRRAPAPPRWRLGGWTDPILARFAGLPAVSILSMGGGMIPEYHRPTDTPDRVDWGCVDACLALARAVLRQN